MPPEAARQKPGDDAPPLSRAPDPERQRLFRALGLCGDDLKGEVALVTGAARGIGQETAVALAALGARVIGVDINPEGASVVQAIRDEGGEAIFVEADVGDLRAVDELASMANDRFGRVDILINNAAQLSLGRVLEQPAAAWNRDFTTNVVGPVTLIQRFAPQMIARRHGVILSLISLEGMPFMGAYCASKMALRSMMLSLGKELPPDAGVSVLSVMPGAVDTPLAREMIASFARLLGLPEADVRASMSRNPGYEGLVPVEHVAASLAWFCANAPQFHGQFLHGYLPMSQAGLIDVAEASAGSAELKADPSVLPNPAPELKRLIEVNRSLEIRIRERTRELEKANAKLQEASLTDPLTGLWNRRYVDTAIVEAISAGARKPAASRTPIHFLMIDIDHFKQINDHLGHLCGDAVLKELARMLKSHVQTTDKILRWGGEEFLIVSSAVEGDQIASLAERLRTAVAEHRFMIEGGTEIRCTCSVGFTSATLVEGARHAPWTSIISMADLCMYAAKRSGRNRWCGIEIRPDSIDAVFSTTQDENIATGAEHGRLEVFSSDPDTQQALLRTALPRAPFQGAEVNSPASA